jgi:hypothetical protein
MNIEKTAVKVYENLFAVAPDGLYRATQQRANGLTMTAARNAARRKIDSFYAMTRYVGDHRTDHRFDFGEFRQGIPDSE